MRNIAGNHNIMIKPAGKGFCVVLWDCDDYHAEAGKKVQDADYL